MILWLMGLVNLYFYFIYHEPINLAAFAGLMLLIIVQDQSKRD